MKRPVDKDDAPSSSRAESEKLDSESNRSFVTLAHQLRLVATIILCDGHVLTKPMERRSKMIVKNAFYLSMAIIGAVVISGCNTQPKYRKETTSLVIQVSEKRTKNVIVALGDSPMDVLERCRPANFYTDDDPWIAFPTVAGGQYVMFFAPSEGGSKSDSKTDKLIAVALYSPKTPGDPIDGRPGTYLLPTNRFGENCPWEYLIGKGAPQID